MPKYEVVSAVRAGGKLHREGEVVELDEDVADGLVELGRLAPAKAAAKPAGKAAAKSDEGGPDKG